MANQAYDGWPTPELAWLARKVELLHESAVGTNVCIPWRNHGQVDFNEYTLHTMVETYKQDVRALLHAVQWALDGAKSS